MPMDKHAYCIMAHGNWQQLQLLVNALDDVRNDIYLHVDRKAEESCLQSEFTGGGEISPIIRIEGLDVRWSHYSQTLAELALFRKVLDSGVPYARVHLISGSDLPVRSQDYIHDFFKDKEEEFLSIHTTSDFSIRIKYYHFFVRHRRQSRLFDIVRRGLIAVQLPFVNRLKKCPLPYAWGANWCSLTLKAVRCICQNEAVCRSIFRYSTSSDELYKQMILNNEPDFRFSSAKEGNLRYVDFSAHQPSPKTLTMADYDKIMASGCLFARKFDVNKDRAVVERILSRLH